MNIDQCYQFGCLSTALQIAIAASGGHKAEWSQERKDMFHKALFYQFMNSVGMIIAYFNMKGEKAYLERKSISAMLFMTGNLLFSFPLYYRCFTDNKKFSFLNPFGGICMIIGWILLSLKK